MTQLSRASKLFPGMPSMFSEFFDDDERFLNFGMSANRPSGVPAANIEENENEFSIDLAVPGLSKKDFQINIDNGNLTIACEKKEEEEVKEKEYTRKEFSYSSFYRSFRLPESVNADKISAEYEDGILTLILPKKEEVKKIPKKEIKIS